MQDPLRQGGKNPKGRLYCPVHLCDNTSCGSGILPGHVSRQIHLALQRITGRSGLPNTIYTDNAQTFHAANREMRELCTVLSAAKTHQYFTEHGIRWKFITHRAVWWGVWWERMVATTKRFLRKVLGRSEVDAEELQTILVGIEAARKSTKYPR
jgi:hypothetical protein